MQKEIKRLKKFTSTNDAGPRRHRKRSKKSAGKKKITAPVVSIMSHDMMGKDAFDNIMKSSLFRFLNEKMYTSSSNDSLQLFERDPKSFSVYHTGFQHQLAQWPQDPQFWIVEYLKSIVTSERKLRVADMGCGDARLARSLNNFKVYSYDLVAVNELVTACDMAHTPLKNARMDYVIFCLSLMGTNCRDFIYEANRILKLGGEVLIVDVASRFVEEFSTFLKSLKQYGLSNEFSETTSDTYFVRARLKKVKDVSHKPVNSLRQLHIKPCVYKKR